MGNLATECKCADLPYLAGGRADTGNFTDMGYIRLAIGFVNSASYLLKRSVKKYANFAKQEPGRADMQDQEDITRNHVQTL